MFSSQINSRDLFFSNPVDQFLGNQGGMKKSGESGFSSSNYSQNTNCKDLTGTSSQDLFSQSQKTNHGESQGNNADYKKYISQNLLFGKNKQSFRRYNFETDEKEEIECFNKKTSLSDDNNLNEVNEIRNLMGCLNESITKLNTEVLDVKDAIRDMKVEITRQNKTITSFEDIVCKQAKLLDENDKLQKRCDKNDKNYIEKMQNIIAKNTEDIMQVLSRLEETTENYKNKTLESIKKFQTSQTNGNKKLLEDSKANNERILRRLDSKMEKSHNEFKNILDNTKEDYNNSMETKLNDIKSFLENFITSIKKPDDSENSSFPSYKVFQKPFPQNPQSIAKPIQYLKSGPSLRSQSCFSDRIPTSCNKNSVHTPLAQSINQSEKSYCSNYSRKNTNQENFCSPKQPVSTNFQTLKIKRKISPSIGSNYSPDFRNDKNSFTSKIMKTSFNKLSHSNSRFANLTHFKNTTPKRQRNNESDCLTACSSPYYTIFETSTMSEKYFI